jgi:hypothetical protein
MHFLTEKLRSYLRDVVGASPQLDPAPDAIVKPLPLFLRDTYQWRVGKLFDHDLLFAIEKSRQVEGEATTPADYVKQADTLREKLGREVVFVLNPVPSFIRTRLVQAQVPFIVPGTQMFLPMLLVDLREHYPRLRPPRPERLLTSAQVIVLHQLIHGSLDGLSQSEIARVIDYTTMMVSNARDQLDAHGLCEVEKRGRAIVLRFPLPRRELWGKASALMTSPIQKRVWITGTIPDDFRCLAGISALSRRSLLGEDAVPTFALHQAQFQALLETGKVHGCPIPADASARAELWKYDPRPLADRSGSVDPFSLYLSLESDPDDRVQQELTRMMEEIAW